jgi:formamidopyrimidine-DNA glycosylase
MPELPEIGARAAEMTAALRGKTLGGIEVLQPKCLNMEAEDFSRALSDATLGDTSYKGKWLLTASDKGYLLLNLGMGGELLLVTRQSLPKKYRLVFDFTDETCLAVNFWWFGYAHYAPADGLAQHPMLGKLGPNVLDLSREELAALMKGRKGNLKAFLLDQSKVAGIGNFYIHDILFLARLHPLRPMNALKDEEAAALHKAIQTVLGGSLEKSGAFYELDLYGKPGNYEKEEIIIGYKEGQPCPVCGSAIIKIKTGGTSSFLCPQCQAL